MKDGFYWVLVPADSNEPEVAELSGGEWFLVGTHKTIAKGSTNLVVLHQIPTLCVADRN